MYEIRFLAQHSFSVALFKQSWVGDNAELTFNPLLNLLY